MDIEREQMARYDYKCRSCEHIFEVIHSIQEDPKIKCEKCKKLCDRQLPTTVHLYGTVGIDWNSDPSKASSSMQKRAQDAKKRKRKF